jgi:hypothetical protein
MNDDDFENRLREIPLGSPARGLQGRVVAQAKALRRRQRRGRLLRGVLLAAALLLVAVNLLFERAYQSRMCVLMTGASRVPRGVAKATGDARAAQMRVQLMNELLRSNGG